MSDLTKHHLQLVGIAKTWALKNLPGWSDESHRDLLGTYGGKAVEGKVSASTMTVPQLGSVLDAYERRGWPRQKKVFGKGDAARKVPPQIAHLVRLWGKLGAAGKVDNDSRPALLAWCARQVNHEVRDLDSLTTAESQKLIEALKGWLGR